MKRLLIAMYRIYFYHQAVAWIVITAGLVAAFLLTRSQLIAMTSRVFAITLVTTIPAIAVIAQFGSVVSNRQVSMIPYGRQFLLGATFSLLVLLCALFGWNLTSVPGLKWSDFIEVWLTVFCLCSISVVIGSGEARWRIFLPLALVILVFPGPFRSVRNLVAALEPPVSYYFLLLIIVICWAWLLRDLRRSVGNARKVQMLFDADKVADLIGNFGSTGMGHWWLRAARPTKPAQLNATRTLFYGIATTRSSRLWFTVARFLILPVIALTYVRVFVEREFWGEVLLLVQLSVLIGIPIGVANWVANLRTLWLRVAGDRKQFWLLWQKLFHAELLLSMLFLTLYMLVVQMIFEVSDVSKALFAVIILLVLPSLCYAAAWFQLGGSFGRVLRVWSAVVYIAVIYVAVIATYASKLYVPVLCLAAISGSVGLVAYFRVRKGFTSLDWLQVRTIMWPKT